MRTSLLYFFLVLHCTVQAKDLFENPGLYQWYEKLYAFEQVDLNHTLLHDASQAEKDFAALNYHWWQLLSSAGGDDNRSKISAIATHYLHKQKKPQSCSDQEIFMAVISASFEARVQMMNSNTFSSAQAYLKAIPYLKVLLERRNRYEEFTLMTHIYEACINEASGHFSYLPLLLLLPESKDDKAFEKLEKTKGGNAICRIESEYFAFKISTNLKEDLSTAQLHLDQLIKSYPDNLVFRIEKLRLLKKMEEPLEKSKEAVTKMVLESNRSKAVKAHFLQLLHEMPT